MMNEATPLSAADQSACSRRVAGAVLLLIGAAALAGRYVPLDFGEAVPLLLGLVFLGAALAGRRRALLIPGGILTGLGTGLLLRHGYGQAAFLFSFAGGWVLITVLSEVAFQRALWWPLYPAGAFAFAGLSRLADAGTREWLQQVWAGWPVLLIAVALFLLLSKPRGKA
jgi:hypothetical protein